jgi:hypothetical protein
MRKLFRLKHDIHAQEAALAARRRIVAAQYHSLTARYHRRLTSPTALVASFVSGLVFGTLARLIRVRNKAGDRSAKQRLRPWIALARAVGGPALLYFLSDRSAGKTGSSRH